MNKLASYILTGLIVCLSSHAIAADIAPSTQVVANQVAYQHVLWDGIPISFSVPVGQERILKFPQPVTLHNTNASLTTDKVAILNNNGFLYVTAKKAFSSIRVPVVISGTGEVVLIDLSAKQSTNDTPVAVMLSDAERRTSSSPNNTTATVSQAQSITFVTMMRYAITHLYAPKRLVSDNPAIARAPMFTSRSVHLFEDGNVTAMPLVSWQGGDLYVTAILLKNRWSSRIVLDPRHIQGHWLAASFYPSNYVMPEGQLHDQTTLYLVSDRPFNDALNEVRGYLS